MSRKLKKKRKTPLQNRSQNIGVDFQKAFQLHQSGALDQAEALYKKILAKDPSHTDSLNLLANIHQQRGDFAKAVTLTKKAIKKRPTIPDYHSNLGSAFRGLKEYSQAIAAFKKAISYKPDHFESLFNLANTYLEYGDLEQAVATIEKALYLKPRMIAAHELLIHILTVQGDKTRARDCLDAALKIAPEHVELLVKKADLLQNLDNFQEAETTYRKALSLAPDHARVWNNLGNTLSKQGRLHDSISYFERAIKFNPDLSEAYINLSWIYKEHGLLDDDVACLQKYLVRHPESAPTHSDLLFSMNYNPAYSPQQLFEASCQWWRQHGHSQPISYQHSRKNPFDKTLKIGFLSPDFRQHPVGSFILPLLNSLADEDVDISCYAEMTSRQHDAITHRVKTLADSWTSTTGLSTDQAAKKIYADQIDILIDLAGHSAGNRLDIMACRPSPIQMSWLGYVNTTGLKTIDYRITDAMADPAGSEELYSEKLIRLPNAFFCFAASSKSPEVTELPSQSTGCITFGSLNNLAKITEQVIELWAAILSQTNGSRLFFVSRQFADDFIRNRYLTLFKKHGVDSSRLFMYADLPMKEYLEFYSKIDIALDPFPHNGHTITCHSLWMGVPVIVLAGDRYAARMGVSVLSGAGLSELIASSRDEYINLAVDLAHDLDRLNLLRQGLREQLLQSDICDSSQFANNFHQALKDAWRNWCTEE